MRKPALAAVLTLAATMGHAAVSVPDYLQGLNKISVR